MNGLRCKPGDMARVARSTTGCHCTRREIGRVIYCETPLLAISSLFPSGAYWALRNTEQCKHCGGERNVFLDADLDPIRPPPIADTTKTDESRPVEAQGA